MDRHGATRQDLLDLVAQVKATLEGSGLAVELSTSIERLERHATVWRSAAWRLGVVGITSAGKSTLLNALLGPSLLPTGVKPSSNALVLCRQGPAVAARIVYLDGQVETVDSRIKERLREVADERSNVGNRLGVEEIELESPGFRLGESVLLVDTPGLDAFQLSAHEQLTMERLVPTVDLVLFVTTTKANSDAQISERLCRIGRHGKPIILVQNMADAVEPKLGLEGEIVKDRAEVLAEHRQRVRRLLDATGVPSVANADIVQVSAQRAIQGEVSQSGLDSLVRCVESTCERLGPSFVAGRADQLAGFLGRTVDLLDEVAEAPARAVTHQRGLADASDALRRSRSELATSLDPLQERLRGRFETTLAELDGLKARHTQLVDKLLTIHGRELSYIAQAVLDAHKESLAADVEVGSALGMPAADLRPRFKSLQPPKAQLTARKTTRQTKDHYVKKKGVGNSIMQGLGSIFGKKSWGRKTVAGHSVQEFDKSHEKQKLRAQREQQSGWLRDAVRTVKADQERRQEIVREELARRKEELAGLRAAAAKSAAKKRLLASLTGHQRDAERLRETARSKTRSHNRADERRAAHATHELSAAMPKLRPAHRVASHVLARSRIELRRRVEARCLGQRPVRRRMLWGWDAEIIEDFRTRFWPAARPAPGSSSSVDRDGTVIRSYVDGLGARRPPGLLRDEVLYLLFDAEQPGAALSALDRSLVPAYLDPGSEHRAVFVVQSVRSASAAGAVPQVLSQLRELLDADASFAGCLVNDEAIAFSVLFDDLLFGTGSMLHADELEWVGRLDRLLAPQDSEQGKACLDALRRWREEGETRDGQANTRQARKAPRGRGGRQRGDSASA